MILCVALSPPSFLLKLSRFCGNVAGFGMLVVRIHLLPIHPLTTRPIVPSSGRTAQRNRDAAASRGMTEAPPWVGNRSRVSCT